MKASSWLCRIAVALLGAIGFPPNTQADDPPWPPLISVVALDPKASEEGADPATFLVVRLGAAQAPLTVGYTLGGAAENGVDYQLLPGEVTIPQGAYFAPVSVTPIDDYEIEGAEPVVLALQQPPDWPPAYIVAWPSVAFAEITDNDREPTNSPPSVALVRPPDGAVFEAGEDVSLVARAYDRDGRVASVEFFDGETSLGIVTNRPMVAVTDLSNTAEDPTFELLADLFPDLDATAGDQPVPVPGSLFPLLWSNPAPGPHVLTAVATDNEGASERSAPVHITVLGPPPQPVVTIRATDPEATEPNPATDYLDTATFKIHRRGATNFPLQVFYRIGGTASNGDDYVSLPRSVTIPEGERTAVLVVEPIDDLLVEGDESVVITLVPPVCIAVYPLPPDCYVVGRAHTARAVIHDNDTPPNQPPLVRLVKPENGEVFLAPAEVRLAAFARDFDGYVVTVEFFEGPNSLGIVTNRPTAESVLRPPFSLVWSNVPPGKYILTAVATDNGGASTESKPVEIRVVPHVLLPEVNITATDPIATEPGILTVIDPATFEVTRTGLTQGPLLVFYSIGGTAENGVDYRSLTGRVEIPAGGRSAEVVVDPLHDLLVEGTETVVLRLEHPPILTPMPAAPLPWYRIGSNNAARAIIRDNDLPPTNHPPHIAIVQPENGEWFHAPVDIQLAALAHDPDGWVRTVEFFAGSMSLGIVTNRPNSQGGAGQDGPEPTDPTPEELFRLVWNEAPPGAHVLTAEATDNHGAKAKSGPVEIRVLPSPPPLPIVTIQATDPFGGEGWALDPWVGGPAAGPDIPYPQPNPAVFTVTRRGNTNDPLTVYYRLGGTAENGVDYERLTGEITIPRGALRAEIVVMPIDDRLHEPTETVVARLVPVACAAVDPPPPGCYVVGEPNEALATIADNDWNHPPKLEIVHPVDGDVFRAHSDIEIDVATVDLDGWVGKMEFFANNVKIGEQVIYFIIPPPPGQPQKFSMVWSNVPAGGYTLTARATDDLGAQSLSDPVRINVGPVPPLPVVTIEAVDRLAAEPDPLLPAFDSARFRVTRTGDLSQPLTVEYRVGGTASNGLDYQALPGAVTIPSESLSAIIEVIPLDDELVEGTESVIIALLQPPCVLSNTVTPGCYLVGVPGRDIAYMRDNDLPNHPPTTAIVSPANGSVFAAPVDLRLVAAAEDPDGWVTTVEFFDGDASLGIVTNPAVILDTTLVRLPELNTDVLTGNTPDRPFTLVWSNVPPGNHILTAVATDNIGDSGRSRPVEIFVREPGNLPVVRIMTTDAVAREGTTNTATFRIHRTGPTNAPLTVFYAIGGSALNGVDYETIPHSLAIPAGRRSARILITPLDDNLPEQIETVLLRLTPPPAEPPSYEIGRAALGVAIILDNDHPLLPQETLADGSLHFRLPVPKGLPFRLEASTNLVDWEEVASAYSAEDGVSVVEANEARHPMRFFRVVPEYGELEDTE